MRVVVLCLSLLFSLAVQASVQQCLQLFELNKETKNTSLKPKAVNKAKSQKLNKEVVALAQELSLKIDQYERNSQLRNMLKDSIKEEYSDYQKKLELWLREQNIKTEWSDIPFYRKEKLKIEGVDFKMLVVSPDAEGLFLNRAAYEFKTKYKVTIAFDPLGGFFIGGRAAYDRDLEVLYMNRDFFELLDVNQEFALQYLNHEEIHMFFDIARDHLSEDVRITQMREWPAHALLNYTEGEFTRGFSFEELIAHGYNVQALVRLYNDQKTDPALQRILLQEINDHKKLLLDYASRAHNFIDELLKHLDDVKIEYNPKDPDFFYYTFVYEGYHIKVYLSDRQIKELNVSKKLFVKKYLNKMAEVVSFVNENIPNENLDDESLQKDFNSLSQFHEQQIVLLKKLAAQK